uniref:Candidate secreted effector n=1 Tax=Meloidogyne incognita TaxID=6306 RepID=A0A914NYA1_MELIC
MCLFSECYVDSSPLFGYCSVWTSEFWHGVLIGSLLYFYHEWIVDCCYDCEQNDAQKCHDDYVLAGGEVPFLPSCWLAKFKLCLGDLYFVFLLFGNLLIVDLSSSDLSFGNLCFGPSFFDELPFGNLSFADLYFGKLSLSEPSFCLLFLGLLFFVELAHCKLLLDQLSLGILSFGEFSILLLFPSAFW